MSPLNALRDRHFIRHYAEMVAAMFAGMIVLGIPGEGLLRLLGSSSGDLADTAPALSLLAMATIMTIPMVALMRWRGHSWRPCWEMAASMYLPTLLAIGLLGAGALTYMGAMGVEHVVMLPAMLVAMLLRPSEYACHAHGEHAGAPVEVIA
jgi:flagellar biosynthetic protein FliP